MLMSSENPHTALLAGYNSKHAQLLPYRGHMLDSILSVIPIMWSEIWGQNLSGLKRGKQWDFGQRLSTATSSQC